MSWPTFQRPLHMHVLCTGDLHIGRRPSRLPADVDGRALSCAQAWGTIVDYAIAHRVDVVALSGDVVDQANRYFEAAGPLEQGIGRLKSAGIVTVAVAGNHDHDVLPELARVFPVDDFRLLGGGGRWQRTTVERPNGDRLHVDGWSFPAEHVRDNPLGSYAPSSAAGDVPVLGLLHADLDAPTSRYAPVALAELRSRAVALWLLGHVHAPALHEGSGAAPSVLYPGSPQAMDPGEAGMHGAWLLELRPGVAARPLHVPLATVRYEVVDVDVGAARDAAELRTVVLEALRQKAAAVAAESGPLRHLSVRVRLVGRTPLHRSIERELAAMAADFDWQAGNVAVHVERVTAATRPARDLDALANGSDAAAIVARLLRDIGQATPSSDALGGLLHEVGGVVTALRQAKPYRAIAGSDDGLDVPALRAAVERQASLLLDELLAQRETVA